MNYALSRLACCGLVLVAFGCSTPSEKTPRQGPFLTAPPDVSDPRFGVFVPQRIDAVLGEQIVIPLELAGGFRPEDVGPFRLDDGRTLPTRLVWIGPEQRDPDRPTWLPSDGLWRSVPWSRSPESEGLASWELAAVIDPPIDAVGQGVWIAGRRWPLNWLPDPFELARRVPAEAWSSPVPASIRTARPVRVMLEPAKRSPWRRWRATLFERGLEAADRPRLVDAEGRVQRLEPAAPGRTVFADPVIDALARLDESRWQIALARLYQADPEINLAVRRRLATYADFGAGAIAPTWPLEAEGIRRLQLDLLDQTLTPRERGRRATLWLEEQPDGLAWLQSDAGLKTAGGDPIASVGLANLRWASSIASVEPFAGGGDPDLETIPPLTARTLTSQSRPSGATRAAVVAAIGDHQRAILSDRADLHARPPGLRIQSLAFDWTLTRLIAHQSRNVVSVDPSTKLLLYQDHLGRWVLYGELQMPQAEDTIDNERLTVAFGPIGSGVALRVVVLPSGEQRLEAETEAAAIDGLDVPELDVETGVYPGGWYVRLVVPRGVIEQGRLLRLGLSRSHASGARSAWPRAMLPWQTTLGRAGIDLARWDDSAR